MIKIKSKDEVKTNQLSIDGSVVHRVDKEDLMLVSQGRISVIKLNYYYKLLLPTILIFDFLVFIINNLRKNGKFLIHRMVPRGKR